MNLTTKQQDDLDILLTLKVREFRKDNIKNINKKQVLDYLMSIKWRSINNIDTCDLVEEVFSVSSAQVYDYLSIRAIQEATTLNIDDFKELIMK